MLSKAYEEPDGFERLALKSAKRYLFEASASKKKNSNPVSQSFFDMFWPYLDGAEQLC